MKNLTLIIFLAIHYSLFTLHSFSQPCLPEGITFSTQAEIDNFQTNYPNCTEIEGSVIIAGNDITNLDGLNVLTSIEGNINIGTFIPPFSWSGNPLLNDLSGLDNLTFIGGDLGIYKNGLLKNLTGLESLTSIDGNLIIGNGWTGWSSAPNDSLVSLIGLDNLTSIGGDLRIRNNNALTSLSGLENLTSVGGDLAIGCGSGGSNAALASISALANVTSIGGGLEVWQNNSLISLTGLDNLTSIGGDFRISHNEALSSLTGLDNIQAETISDLIIYENSSLSTCEVYSVCSYLASPNGTIDIHNNAPGCNSQEEVDSLCNLVSVKEISFGNEFSISPNPFESATFIHYTLHQNSLVSLKILDLSGRLVVSLVNKFQQQGEQRIDFNTTGLPAGIYFCVLKTNNPAHAGQTIKLIKQ